MIVKLLEDGRHYVEISHSSMTTWRSCLRKAYLQHREGLLIPKRKEGDTYVNLSSSFGSGLHLACPIWSLTGNLEAAFQKFDEGFNVPIEQEGGYHTRSRARAILTTYASRYAKDDGKDRKDRDEIVMIGTEPIVEKTANPIIYQDDEVVIVLVTKIDRLVWGKSRSGEPGIWVPDLKTTGSSISPDSMWYEAQSKSSQYTGYNLAAAAFYGDILGVPILGTIIDAIYTKRKVVVPADMARYPLERDRDRERGLVADIVSDVKSRIIPAWEGKIRPSRTSPQSCTLYNRPCRYLPFCTDDMEDTLVQCKDFFQPPEPRPNIDDAPDGIEPDSE